VNSRPSGILLIPLHLLFLLPLRPMLGPLLIPRDEIRHQLLKGLEISNALLNGFHSLLQFRNLNDKVAVPYRAHGNQGLSAQQKSRALRLDLLLVSEYR